MQMASNVCAEYPTKALSPGATDAIPTLLSLLVRDDKKVATLACNCLVSIVEGEEISRSKSFVFAPKGKEEKEHQLERQPSAAKDSDDGNKVEERGEPTTNDTSNDRRRKKKEKSSSEMDPVVANETVSLILSDALCERCLEIVREAAGNNSSTNNVANSRVLYRGCVKILATILEARPEMSIFLLEN